MRNFIHPQISSIIVHIVSNILASLSMWLFKLLSLSRNDARMTYSWNILWTNNSIRLAGSFRFKSFEMSAESYLTHYRTSGMAYLLGGYEQVWRKRNPKVKRIVCFNVYRVCTRRMSLLVELRYFRNICEWECVQLCLT